MKDFAKKYIQDYQKQSTIVKILLCLLWDIPSNIYRFSKSAQKDSTLGMVLAILLAIFGGWILFVIDIISLAVKGQIYWLDDLGIDESKLFEEEDKTDSSSTDDGIDGTVE